MQLSDLSVTVMSSCAWTNPGTTQSTAVANATLLIHACFISLTPLKSPNGPRTRVLDICGGAVTGHSAGFDQRRSRRALSVTVIVLALIASAAHAGLSRMPSDGYSTPAASGIATRL